MPVPERMQQIQAHFFASLSRRIAELKAEGRDVIRLDEGAPDLPPPAEVIEALSRAASRPDAHGYQPHLGPDGLRRAWADHYRKTYGADLDPGAEITPLLGSKEGIFHSGLAWVSPGEVVLTPDPGYISYTRSAQMAGAEIYHVRLRPEDGFLPDLASIPEQILARTRLLWLNYPNNPTSATADRQFFTQVVELAAQYNFLICHDAAYTQVAFDGERPPSILEVAGAKEVAVEFNTLSKSHNMAGWRSGVLVGNAEAVKLLYTLKTNADSGHFLPIWEASIAALQMAPGWIEARNAVYARRRDLVMDGLRRAGIRAQTPRASLYIWAEVPDGSSSVDFTSGLLEHRGVSFTPGTVFGPGGEGYIRISITAPEERIEQAMERLRVGLGTGA